MANEIVTHYIISGSYVNDPGVKINSSHVGKKFVRVYIHAGDCTALLEHLNIKAIEGAAMQLIKYNESNGEMTFRRQCENRRCGWEDVQFPFEWNDRGWVLREKAIEIFRGEDPYHKFKKFSRLCASYSDYM